MLFYGTGGGAFGDVQQNNGNLTVSYNQFGWTAGAGVEAAFTDNITGRIEYLYVDLGTTSCSIVCFPGVATSKPPSPPVWCAPGWTTNSAENFGSAS